MQEALIAEDVRERAVRPGVEQVRVNHPQSLAIGAVLQDPPRLLLAVLVGMTPRRQFLLRQGPQSSEVLPLPGGAGGDEVLHLGRSQLLGEVARPVELEEEQVRQSLPADSHGRLISSRLAPRLAPSRS